LADPSVGLLFFTLKFNVVLPPDGNEPD